MKIDQGNNPQLQMIKNGGQNVLFYKLIINVVTESEFNNYLSILFRSLHTMHY